jgi:hypothetical protein
MKNGMGIVRTVRDTGRHHVVEKRRTQSAPWLWHYESANQTSVITGLDPVIHVLLSF